MIKYPNSSIHWFGNMCITLPLVDKQWELNTAISDEIVEFTPHSMRDHNRDLADALERWLKL